MSLKQFKQLEVDSWIHNPLTQEFLRLIEEHRDAAKELVSESTLNIRSLQELDLYQVAEYRGNYNTLNFILNIREFLEDNIKQEVNNETQTSSHDG